MRRWPVPPVAPRLGRGSATAIPSPAARPAGSGPESLQTGNRGQSLRPIAAMIYAPGRRMWRDGLRLSRTTVSPRVSGAPVSGTCLRPTEEPTAGARGPHDEPSCCPTRRSRCSNTTAPTSTWNRGRPDELLYKDTLGLRHAERRRQGHRNGCDRHQLLVRVRQSFSA